ncbi:hypothetical protein D3C87_1814490 [compost metagenome]
MVALGLAGLFFQLFRAAERQVPAIARDQLFRLGSGGGNQVGMGNDRTANQRRIALHHLAIMLGRGFPPIAQQGRRQARQGQGLIARRRRQMQPHLQ